MKEPRTLDTARIGGRTQPAAVDERARLNIPTVAELAGGDVTVLRRATGGTPTELSREEREQLIADARAGKLVSVQVEAVTFVQRETPNRNLVRFSAGALRSMAPSFAGMPVLRDHAQEDSLARGGRVVESKLEDRADGAKQIRMMLELTAPWAVEMALRGLMDRFSIGWHSTGDTVCSVCQEPMTRFWMFTFGECDHQLGESYDGNICQLEFTEAEGVEVSAVSVPAVLGTGVQDIRAQLSAARSARPASLGHHKEPPMSKSFPLILAALSLSADAGEVEIVSAIEALTTDRDGARAKAKDAGEQLAAAHAELATVQQTAKDTRIKAALARGLDEGRFLPSSRTEAHAQKLAARGDVEGLEAFVEDLEPGLAAPIRKALASGGSDPSPRLGDALTDEDKAAARRMKVSDEEFLKQKRAAFATQA